MRYSLNPGVRSRVKRLPDGSSALMAGCLDPAPRCRFIGAPHSIPLLAARKAEPSGWSAASLHPSGDPSPSAEDLAFTRRMAEAGEVVGVRVVDHIIIGEAPAFVSLRQHGAF
ncbi:MAG: hypothetical protein KJ058_05850 [Thermoanaerobaculia bacterium]|nr:hypothetical protein [Thermoanaerobaculia bacterium]